MGSLGTGELIVIAIAALVVFGPKRLPELARKAGELLEKARTATRSLTESLDGDYGDIAAPLQTLKSEYDATVKEIKNIGTTVTGIGTTLPGENVASSSQEEDGDNEQSTTDSSQEEDGDNEQSTTDSSQEEDGDNGQSIVDHSEEEEADGGGVVNDQDASS